MPDDADTVTPLVFEGALTLRRAEELCATLAAAVTQSPVLAVDCSAASDIDLSFVQLLLAARRSAVQAGGDLRLATPPAGKLLETLTRGGFAVTSCDIAGQAPAFWFEGTAA